LNLIDGSEKPTSSR